MQLHRSHWLREFTPFFKSFKSYHAVNGCQLLVLMGDFAEEKLDVKGITD